MVGWRRVASVRIFLSERGVVNVIGSVANGCGMGWSGWVGV